ncbi:MAG TPA: hypothetical protein VFR00_11205 [Hyphomicrobiaceae bacterium]|jgi:hypothetical protein|nr:hypothetical protein [Hyphomicrobiaceae bacterium]
MPRVNAAESFLWRAAPQPGRTRLLGALAIALSCGALGVLAGRWSIERVPSEPGTRTAALIEAVAKETQAKLAVAARAPQMQAAPPAGISAAVAPAAPSAPTASRANSAVTPEPPQEPSPSEPAAGEATPLSRSEHAEQQQPAAVRPAARELRRPQPREPHETTAPDYRALRDYVLSR